MVLTSLDSVLHWATSPPIGPVHHSYLCNNGTHGQMEEVLENIQSVNKGLLLVGAISTEDERWAVLHVAKYLQWPVVADILSGIRLRKLLSSSPEVEENIVFVDYLDHALLSDFVRNLVRFDVIVQIGSRITSKRISQMLEKCFPCSYILVDDHPNRHDPSHFVTQRIQISAIEFANILLKAQIPHRSRKWHDYLQALNMMVGQEISFQVSAEHFLLEPYIAHVISEALSSESALLIGNSMVIRDADMYGYNWRSDTHSVADMILHTELPCTGILVAGNRGASGIDGLLSTAVAPLEICQENLLDVEEQLRFLFHAAEGASINYFLPMLKSSFSSWIWKTLGIPVGRSIYFLCGLEMATLNAIAVSQGSCLLNILHPLRERKSEKSPSVRICALLDSSGTPEEVGRIATDLVKEGFTAIKIKILSCPLMILLQKVARRADPVEDAAVKWEVRKKDSNLQYIEVLGFPPPPPDFDIDIFQEPVQGEADIIRFCEESGLPMALDETIDKCPENPLNMLVKYNHPGIVALVIKPTVIGGFERAAIIARWAQRQGKLAVVSAAFESGLALSAYIVFSCYLDWQNADTCKLMNNNLVPSVAHGLGTFRWLEEDVTTDLLGIEHITPGKVTLVGYSMGARIALYMALKFGDTKPVQIEGAVILSGSPGLENAVARKVRRAKDDSKACSLVTHGLKLFLDTWYSGGLRKSLRKHPNFNQIVSRRSLHNDSQVLARVLSDLSPGRQP
ncbi:Menaquinone biosynthesis protein, putative isoform 2 [Hibiscus syriacus]|uniref:Menaquinone biosynthesis protein, putative isoform 2 n=1 Tax=Hibiscus syriacus TaxID=106335 RepID=A0A6A2XKR7_HIBSY|nr:Menaquinone biosynthesis protein, putative isoform 2 [Hibiscus syriacus]